MSEIVRFKVNWAGISGGTGVNTLHFIDEGGTGITTADVNAVAAAVRLMFENTSEWLPNDVTVSFPATVDIIESDDGKLVRAHTASTPATPITGAYTGNWQNGVGTRIVWHTGEVGPKKRIRGATYLVPYGGIWDNDGTLSSAAATDVAGVAATLLSSMNTAGTPLCIYSYTRFDPALVLSASVSDKTVVLRTRRD